MKKMSYENRPEGTCFTLIELLVVISIIAILAGMLLPALNRARMMAHSISCLNQEKQLALCMLSYGNDFKFWVPGASVVYGDSNQHIVRFLSRSDRTDYPRCYLGYVPSQYTERKGIWICPGGLWEREVTPTYASFQTNYSIPTFGSDTANVKYDQGFVQLNSIKAPTKRGWLGDSWDPTNYYVARHMQGGNINFAFVDGHAESIPRKKLLFSDYVGASTIGKGALAAGYHPFTIAAADYVKYPIKSY